MRGTLHCCFILALAIVGNIGSPVNGQHREFSPAYNLRRIERDLEFETRRLDQAELLPFQALRLKLILSCKPDTLPPIRDLRSLSECEIWVQNPGETDLVQVRLYRQEVGTETGNFSDLIRERTRYVPELYPTETISLCLPLACHWDPSSSNATPRFTVFDSPGVYQLEIRYPTGSEEKPFHVASLEITVEEPVGDDLLIFNMLHEDAALQAAMLSAIHSPPDDVLPKLRQIMEEYPNSSYADYARFALARWILHGTMWWDEHRLRTSRTKEYYHGFIEGYVERANTNNWEDELLLYVVGHIIEYAGTNVEKRTVLTGERAEIVRGLLPALRGPMKAPGAIDILAELAYVSPEERAEARELLEGIRQADFPYRPNALCLYRLALDDDDEEGKQQISEEMNEHYRDSVEWIKVMSMRAGLLREWREFRIPYTPER